MQVGKLYRMTLDVGFYKQDEINAVSLKKDDVVVYLGSRRSSGNGWWTHTWLAPTGEVICRHWSNEAVLPKCADWFELVCK